MDLKVGYQNTDSKEKAFKAACKEITPEYVGKFNVKADIDINDQSKKIVATGKGFELKIDFSEYAAQVSLDLSFMLRPFKGKILETIERKLKKTV